MAKFLNRPAFSEAIKALIQDAKEEILFVVPFIKTSSEIFELLRAADDRGVEITIIYKENGMTEQERGRYEELKNLNLLFHQFLHAKSYMNEETLIIGSMNLYEYSEKNNREMGVLLEKDTWRDEFFEEAVDELRLILNASSPIRTSLKTEKNGIDLSILLTDEERLEHDCKKLSRYFVNKRFKPVKTEHDHVVPYCKGYSDHIDVYWAHRIGLVIDKAISQALYSRFMQRYGEFMFAGLKTYWNNPDLPLYLYQDSRSNIWNEPNTEEYYQHWKAIIDDVTEYLKPMIFQVINR